MILSIQKQLGDSTKKT
jgi:hypothetical protein